MRYWIFIILAMVAGCTAPQQQPRREASASSAEDNIPGIEGFFIAGPLPPPTKARVDAYVAEQTWVKIPAQCFGSIVDVLHGQCRATGICVDRELVLTVQHIRVHAGDEVLVAYQDRHLKGEVLLADQTLDVAMIHVPRLNVDKKHLVRFRCGAMVGEEFAVLCFATSEVFKPSIRAVTGRVTALLTPKQLPGLEILETDLRVVHPGNSGAPLLDNQGYLLGLIKGEVTYDGVRHIVAVSAHQITDWMRAHKDELGLNIR